MPSTPDKSRTAGPRGAHRSKWLIGLGITAAVFAVAVVLFDWNWLKGPIERKVTEATGRTLTIGGPLKGSIGWLHFNFSAEDVRFANPPWARTDKMVEAGRLALRLDIPALFAGNIFLKTVELDQPKVNLEVGRDGAKNWLLDREQKDEDSRLRVGVIAVRDGRITYFDPREDTDVAATVSTPPEEPKLRERFPDGVQFAAKGKFRKRALQASGGGSSVLGLEDPNQPYSFVARMSWGKTRAAADGSISGLLEMSRADLQVELSGENLADLDELLKVALPPTRPYQLRGHVTGGGKSWRIADLKGRVGESDASGEIAISTAGKPSVQAKLHSKLLDLDELGALVSGGGDEKTQAAKTPTDRALPDVAFSTEKWSTLNADVELTAAQIKRDGVIPWRELTLHAILKDSVMTLTPLEFRLAGGQLHVELTMDGNRKPLTYKGRGAVRNVLLSELAPKLVPGSEKEGRFTGSFNLAGNGSSLARMLARANGDLQLVLGPSSISNLALEVVGLDIAEALKFFLGKDKKAQLRCGIAAFDVKDGLMESKLFVLDTSDTNIAGSGNINFQDEALDIRLEPKPKDMSFLSLRSPLLITGTLKNPRVRPEAKAFGARIGAAVALGVINPFAALLALIETGPGKDSDCARLIAEGQRAAAAKPAAARTAVKGATTTAKPGASAPKPAQAHPADQKK